MLEVSGLGTTRSACLVWARASQLQCGSSVGYSKALLPASVAWFQSDDLPSTEMQSPARRYTGDPSTQKEMSRILKPAYVRKFRSGGYTRKCDVVEMECADGDEKYNAAADHDGIWL